MKKLEYCGKCEGRFCEIVDLNENHINWLCETCDYIELENIEDANLKTIKIIYPTILKKPEPDPNTWRFVMGGPYDEKQVDWPDCPEFLIPIMPETLSIGNINVDVTTTIKINVHVYKLRTDKMLHKFKPVGKSGYYKRVGNFWEYQGVRTQ